MDRLPVFTTQAGTRIVSPYPGVEKEIAALVNAVRSRNVIAIVTASFVINVTVEGVTAALFGDEVWVEPFGWVSMWNADGWLVVAIDAHPDLPDIELRLRASRVVDVLADIALAAFTDGAAARGGAA